MTNNANYYKRIAEELAEANEPRNRKQAQVDAWWESERALEEEINDVYTVCGFQEKWSTTPSFTKSPRDRDWRVR